MTDIDDVNKILDSIKHEPAKPGSQQRGSQQRVVVPPPVWVWVLTAIAFIVALCGGLEAPPMWGLYAIGAFNAGIGYTMGWCAYQRRHND